MTEDLQAILRAEAERAGIVDPDLAITLPIFDDIRNRVTDEVSARKAARDMKRARPALFQQPEWSGDPDSPDWREREEKFRASLRTSTPLGPTYSELDAALLSSEELQAMDRVLRGHGGSYDRSILRYALSRQKAGEAVLNGGQNE